MIQLFIDILFPKTCISCSREGQHLCQDCLAFIPIASAPSPLPSHSPLSGLFCAASYEEPLIRKAIQNFKYRPYLKNLAMPLASLIIAHLSFIDKPFSSKSSSLSQDFLLCPVPLSKRRLRERGFNHAEEIAKVLSSVLGIPTASLLEKIKHTAPQVELKEKERKENVAGVFRVCDQEEVQNKKILLVDDVFTTGATMEECTRVLRKAGAKRVWGVVVARG